MIISPSYYFRLSLSILLNLLFDLRILYGLHISGHQIVSQLPFPTSYFKHNLLYPERWILYLTDTFARTLHLLMYIFVSLLLIVMFYNRYPKTNIRTSSVRLHLSGGRDYSSQRKKNESLTLGVTPVDFKRATITRTVCLSFQRRGSKTINVVSCASHSTRWLG